MKIYPPLLSSGKLIFEYTGTNILFKENGNSSFIVEAILFGSKTICEMPLIKENLMIEASFLSTNQILLFGMESRKVNTKVANTDESIWSTLENDAFNISTILYDNEKLYLMGCFIKSESRFLDEIRLEQYNFFGIFELNILGFKNLKSLISKSDNLKKALKGNL